MIKRVAAAVLLLGMGNPAWAEPVALRQAQGERYTGIQGERYAGIQGERYAGIQGERDPVVPGEWNAGNACPRRIQPADGKGMVEAMRVGLMEFVQNNYPSCVSRIARSLQGKEGPLRQELTRTADFLRGFALGPVTFEGAWSRVAGDRQYVLLGIIRGVKGHPAATVFMHTYPGMFKPFTVVSVDRDGDGKVDLESERFSERDTLESWLLRIFPA